MFGVRELKPQIHISQENVECPVIGCNKWVVRQRHSFKREARFRCPEHKIYISPTTFEYGHEEDNLLWTSMADLSLLKAIKKVKRESRISRDNSEDAVTWNVFRYFESTQQLSRFLSSITYTEQQHAELIYWSYSQKATDAWPELNKARKEFGENLQRSSEPDLIAVTDKALFFIEVKLTAPNKVMPSNKTYYKNYLIGGDEWFRQVFTSDFETIAITSKLFELLRFWLLGSWMASQTGQDFYLINIVLSEREKDIELRFHPHIRKKLDRQFKRVTWEEIYSFIVNNAPDNDDKSLLVEYFRNKTVGYNHFGKLQKAFMVE
jgi:hypothetical protein